jgi:hypothetical protein
LLHCYSNEGELRAWSHWEVRKREEGEEERKRRDKEEEEKKREWREKMGRALGPMRARERGRRREEKEWR